MNQIKIVIARSPEAPPLAIVQVTPRNYSIRERLDYQTKLIEQQRRWEIYEWNEYLWKKKMGGRTTVDMTTVSKTT